MFGSFGVVVGLMVVLGVTAVVELGSVDNRAEYLGTNSLPAAQTIGTVETAAANYRRVRADLVVARPARQAKLASRVAEQSSASTQQVSASTEETSASAEQITASAQELAATAQSLERLAAQFQL